MLGESGSPRRAPLVYLASALTLTACEAGPPPADRADAGAGPRSPRDAWVMLDDTASSDAGTRPDQGLDARDGAPATDAGAEPGDTAVPPSDGSTDLLDAEGRPADAGGCRGIFLRQSGILDVDLAKVDVTGRVRLEGGALPDTDRSRGRLIFRRRDVPSQVSVDLGARGTAEYRLTLSPGEYEVVLDAEEALCSAPDNTLPCIDGVLIEAIHLTSDGVLDVDIPAIVVTGRVLVNHQPAPSEGAERGALIFKRATGEAAAAPGFGAAGQINYRMVLLPGRYQVLLEANEALCAAPGALPTIPCVDGVLLDGLDLHSDGVLDVDVLAITVTGNMRLNGQPFPDQTRDRGRVRFSLAGGGSVTSPTFGLRGPARYGLRLLPGIYQIRLDANEALPCDPLPQVPCADGVLFSAQRLSTDGVLDLDVPAVTVTGDVTLLGQPMPEERADRGRLSFISAGGDRAVTRTFGAAGPVSYALRLFPGPYRVRLEANPDLCVEHGRVPRVPCSSGRLLDGLRLTADGRLDVDLPAVTVTGNVTLDGAPLPDERAERGRLALVSTGGESVLTQPFGWSGAAAYGVTLLPGDYAVRLDAEESLCAEPTTLPKVPCIDGLILGPRSLRASGVMDVDLSALTVSGHVTQDGQPLPDATGPRGRLELVRADSSELLGAGLRQAGVAAYALRLLPGPYLVRHAAEPGLCDGRSFAGVPCTGAWLLGCP